MPEPVVAVISDVKRNPPELGIKLDTVKPVLFRVKLSVLVDDVWLPLQTDIGPIQLTANEKDPNGVWVKVPVARVRLSGVAPVSVTVPVPERLKVSTSLPPALNLSLTGVRVTVTMTELLPLCRSVTEPKGEVPQLLVGGQLLSVKKVWGWDAGTHQRVKPTNTTVATKDVFNI